MTPLNRAFRTILTIYRFLPDSLKPIAARPIYMISLFIGFQVYIHTLERGASLRLALAQL